MTAQEATSMSLIVVISPEDSWMTQMAEDKSFLQRNIHNISVPGRLPNATTQDLKNQRIRYRSKGFFFKGELYFQLPDILQAHCCQTTTNIHGYNRDSNPRHDAEIAKLTPHPSWPSHCRRQRRDTNQRQVRLPVLFRRLIRNCFPSV